MNKIKILTAISASLILAVGLSSAFVLIGGGIKWQNTPREILVRDAGGHNNVGAGDPDGGVTQVANAIEAEWDNAGAGNLLTATLDPSPPLSIGDGISVMGFNVTGSGCSGGCLAVTLIPASGPGGETHNGVNFLYMNDADIFFNPSAKFYSDLEANGCKREYHIETVGVHEAGHLLGLGHTPVTSAVMYAFSGFCSKLSLQQDDEDGVNCIYGNGSCGACVPDTLVVDQTNCDQPSSGPNAGDFVVETFIVDNCGSPVAGADVTIDIPTSPQGPLSCSGTTASNGRLGCALDNPPDGPYESLVGDVSAAGFNNWNGSECGGVGQPPCGCSIEIGGGTGCTPTSNKEKGPKCSDGLDNDCDGFIDGDDPDC